MALPLRQRVGRAVAKLFGYAPISDQRGSWWPWVREPYTGAWQRNVEWSIDTVAAHHAVYACITLIANDVGKLRQKLVEADADDIWSETQSSAFTPVLRKPNSYQNHIQFKQWWITSKLFRGNTYALKKRDERRVVTSLYILDPNRVTILVSPDGSVFYRLSADNLSGIEDGSIDVPASEIIHDRMNCLFHPLIGVSPLFAAGLAASSGISMQNNQSNFFTNQSQPGGILTAPGAISDETAARLRAYWEANFTGANAGRVAIAGDGLKFEPLRMTAVDSQLIEQLRWTAEVVCSCFHVPPYKVGVGQMPTYNNIEALQQEYYSTCLQTLIEEYELCLDEGLGLDLPINNRRLGVELDLDGLLRMDTATLIDTMGKGVTNALMTTDEARRRLNLKRVAGGDVVWRQQQYFSLEDLANRTPAEAAAQSGQAVTPPAANEDEVEDADESAAAVERMFAT